MDDARIRQLTQEVLAQIGGASAASSRTDTSSPGLEARVLALEGAVARLQGGPPPPPAASRGAHVQGHPSLQALRVEAGSTDRCVVEPDKPCVQSGQCRALGH
jgi:hypothetical protein